MMHSQLQNQLKQCLSQLQNKNKDEKKQSMRETKKLSLETAKFLLFAPNSIYERSVSGKQFTSILFWINRHKDKVFDKTFVKMTNLQINLLTMLQFMPKFYEENAKFVRLRTNTHTHTHICMYIIVVCMCEYIMESHKA